MSAWPCLYETLLCMAVAVSPGADMLVGMTQALDAFVSGQYVREHAETDRLAYTAEQ